MLASVNYAPPKNLCVPTRPQSIWRLTTIELSGQIPVFQSVLAREFAAFRARHRGLGPQSVGNRPYLADLPA
jgi:hypothetical protein